MLLASKKPAECSNIQMQNYKKKSFFPFPLKFLYPIGQIWDKIRANTVNSLPVLYSTFMFQFVEVSHDQQIFVVLRELVKGECVISESASEVDNY